jgi:hypothetical protein
MENNTTELAYEQKCEGKWILFKLLLLALYVGYTVTYLYVIIKTGFFPLGALIPFTLWIIVYFTWRYTSPDYKYTIGAGTLTFSVSYGKKTHEKFKIHLKDALAIAPRERIGTVLKETKIHKSFSALPSKSESEVYAIAFKKETKVYILHLKVTRDTVKALYYYNKNTIIKEDLS